MTTSPIPAAIEPAREFCRKVCDAGCCMDEPDKEPCTEANCVVVAFVERVRQEEREAIAAFLPDDGDGCGPNDFARAAIERARQEERERCALAITNLQEQIHTLCPVEGCQDGMLYYHDGKTAGACEWHGHVLGGYT